MPKPKWLGKEYKVKGNFGLAAISSGICTASAGVNCYLQHNAALHCLEKLRCSIKSPICSTYDRNGTAWKVWFMRNSTRCVHQVPWFLFKCGKPVIHLFRAWASLFVSHAAEKPAICYEWCVALEIECFNFKASEMPSFHHTTREGELVSVSHWCM